MVGSPDEPPRLGARFDAALAYAVEHHRHQRRKGSRVPYAAHLLAVCAVVLEMDGTEDEAIAALLHDVVEDGGGEPALAHIERSWGPEVARVVSACSDTTTSPKPPWRERKAAHVTAAGTAPPDVLRVLLADKLHNARSILVDHRRLGDSLWSRFSAPGGSADVRWYHRAMCEALEGRAAELGPAAGPALAELRATVDALDAAA